MSDIKFAFLKEREENFQ